MNPEIVKSSDTDQADGIVTLLKTLMIEHSCPLWARAGWDHKRGGFLEQLNADGSPDYTASRRVRVQARQIYCFAKAAQLGWYSEGKELALRGLDYLLKFAKSPDRRPGFVHLLTPDGNVDNPLRDTYDHAFILLALATVLTIHEDAQIRTEIDDLLQFIDSQLTSPSGGLLEGIPNSLPRRQNPHMHMFEAMIALFDATGEAQFQNRAGTFYSLFLANLFDTKSQTLGEFFEEDWAPIKPSIVEPGHQAEWVWLLKGFERITGCPTGKHRTLLLNSALLYRDATGCLVDEGDIHGRPTKTTRRLWPQTEMAKAWIAQAEGGEEGAAKRARTALSRLEKHYLRHPVRGAWYDQFDGEGNLTVTQIPASSFYHILCAIGEAEAVLI